jgi:hypothetical protein
MKINRTIPRSLVLASAVFFTAHTFAGLIPEFKQTQAGLREEPPAELFKAEVDQTFQSEFKSGHGRAPGDDRPNNNTNTWHYEIAYSHRTFLAGHWYLRLGFDLNRYDFGDNRSFAPTTLQSYAAVIALEYFVGKDIGFFIRSEPGLYFASDLNGKAFDAPTDIVLIYPLIPKEMYLIGGVSLSLLRSYPVLPVGGILWHINEQWDLRGYVPDPRIVYKSSDKLELWAGGEIVGGGFRADGSNHRELNGTTVTYDELRAGAGLTWTGWKPVAIDFGAGWAFLRKFDFNRADEHASTEGAPYVRLTATVDF